MLNAEDIATSLTLDQLVGDRTHLNRIASDWEKCEEVPRTSTAAEVTVSMYLRESEGGSRSVVKFPDLSGESFSRQISHRTCERAYVEGLEGSGGILLFITANRVQDDVTIVDAASMYEGDKNSVESTEPVGWSPKMIPAQVQLVDLLQFLDHPPFRRGQRRVAVIVSAWDVVAEPKPRPDAWVQREMPLLHQYLMSNINVLESQVYGVSAQGGDVHSAADKENLLKLTPSKRIACVSVNGSSHDLSGPIHWLMKGG